MKQCITQVITRYANYSKEQAICNIINFARSCSELFKIINVAFDEEFILDVIRTNITVYQKILFESNRIICVDQFTDKIILIPSVLSRKTPTNQRMANKVVLERKQSLIHSS
ncbi:Hypothetical_protein [Hexamita inflata]|uniref:Hypothetical_protein n=1 Tax=Hexamita inflata TaxID=28002 RepID=A0ABP1HHV8_9EUKA